MFSFVNKRKKEKERIRTAEISLRKSEIELKRLIEDNQTSEKNNSYKISRMKASNQLDEGELARYVVNIHSLRSTRRQLNTRLQFIEHVRSKLLQVKHGASFDGSLSSVTKALKAANKNIDIKTLMQTASEFSKESDLFDVTQSEIDELCSGADQKVDSEAINTEIESIWIEHGLRAAPKKEPTREEESEVDEKSELASMTERMNKL